MSVTDVDAGKIKDCVREVLAERTTIDPETHKNHHQSYAELLPELRDFLAYRAVRMQQMKQRQEFWARVRSKTLDTSVGAVVLALVGGIISAIAWFGSLAVEAIAHALHLPPGG